MKDTWDWIKSLIYAFLFGGFIGAGLTVFIMVNYGLVDYLKKLEPVASQAKHDVLMKTSPKPKVSQTQAEINRALAITLEELGLLPADLEDEMLRNGLLSRSKQNTENIRPDDELKSIVTNLFSDDPVLSASNIEVDVKSAKVTLSAKPLPPKQIGRAFSIAYQVEGVTQVISNIEVKQKSLSIPAQ